MQMFFVMETRSAPFIFQKKSKNQVLNVILIISKEKSHNVLIKDFDRLMYSKAKTKYEHKTFFCIASLQHFLLKKYFLIHY